MDTAAVERGIVVLPIKLRALPGLRAMAVAAATLAAVAGGGWYAADWWRTARFVEATDDAYAGGNVTAISPHVAGFVAQILVADNQHVAAGQVVIRLDDRDFVAALKHATAVAAQRRAALASLEARLVLQRAAIREAEATLAAKESVAEFARQEEARYRVLASILAGSQQNAQRAQAGAGEARANAAAATAALAAARQQLEVLNVSLAEARAAVAQADADVETARLNLGYTEIRAPIEGYVGNRAAQVGAYVTGGAYLLSVIPSQGLWIEANFKEDQLAGLRPGQPATVTADVLPDKVFHGHVESLAPGTGAIFSVIPPENATGNFTKIVQRVPVRIALDDASFGELRPGLSATVRVDTRPNP